MNDDTGAAAGPREWRRIAVWDLPTRLFHWTLVVLFVALWYTGTEGVLALHMRIGEAVLAMLLFRLVWGLVGSPHSRFADFVAGPRAALAHLAEVIAVARHGPAGALDHRPHVGHTRLGGWMILALLLLMSVECATGLFSTDDIATDAPLNHLVSADLGRSLTAIHSGAFNFVVALAIVHISAALFYLVRKRENLILPLITGRAHLPAEAAEREGRFASPRLAVALLVGAILIVWGIISL
jgi:cytochrome b